MKYMNKREILIEFIKSLDNEKLDDVYSILFNESNKKTDLIIDKLLPFITYIYMTLTEEQINMLFTNHNH
jgi:hypothetical protein